MRRAARAPLVAALVLVGGCSLGTRLDDADAGPQAVGLVPCDDPSVCPDAAPACVFGVCKRPCAADEACPDATTFCDVARQTCEPGCRDSSACGDGTACSAGTCIVARGCLTKCDCAANEVCDEAGACVAPPGSCAGPGDCGRGADGDACGDVLCDAFSARCYDPTPRPCAGAADCLGRPGCEGGCVCTSSAQCVADAACTPANERAACGPLAFCDGNSWCSPAPPCSDDGGCGALDFVCDVALGVCARSAPCADSASCVQEPATFCADGRCAVPTCRNGGAACDADEDCTADGRCVPVGTGASCTSDAACADDEYCALVSGAGQCAVGCRNNAACAPGEQCNGAHQCVAEVAPGGLDEPCLDEEGLPADAQCASGLSCRPTTGTCAEACAPPSSSCGIDECCALTGQGCCDAAGYCASPAGGC